MTANLFNPNTMKITFRINYRTNWGERIIVVGSLPGLGDWDKSEALQLRYTDGGDWVGEVSVADANKTVEYKYFKVDDDFEVLDEDWGQNRSFDIAKNQRGNVAIVDTWRAKSHRENVLYTSAFQEVIFKPALFKDKVSKQNTGVAELRFQLHAPRVEPGMQICVSGNTAALGNWDLAAPLLLGNAQFPLWSGAVAVETKVEIEYKYGIYDPQKKQVQYLEKGANRKFAPHQFPAKTIIKTDEYFDHLESTWRGVGVAVPVFSLRSKKGFGVGEFSDIKLLVDWAKKVNMKMVQILPINDTTATYTWVDSYPYSCISVFALHPLYLSLDEVEGFKTIVDQKQYDREKKKLNGLQDIDYEEVMRLKFKYAREVFEKQKGRLLKRADFKKFINENQHWLKPYALFSQLRDRFKTADFNEWGKFKKFSSTILKKETDPKSDHFDEVAFYYFLQFHLDKQLKAASGYARQNGIILKGDIPIGIYRHSVDAWTDPHLFNMDGQSGAPPDPFSDIGQNWGFPTYNWAEMAKDGYQWWQNRLRQLSRYFDAFRIDHILGFFRIWQIPLDQVEGTFGFFNPAIPVQRKEFEEQGIWFEYGRFCRPYITADILNSAFGEDAIYVAETFLVKDKSGKFYFQKEFDTQRKVEAYVDCDENTGVAHLKDGLFKLLSNVLFFEVPGSKGQAFHPRIDFQKTLSFKALSQGVQSKLAALYDDYFYHRQDGFWKQEAMTKLPAIKEATNMLICGEDLGMVPDCVPGVMSDLGFLTLEIQRMSKNPHTEFLEPQDIPYLSVITPGTHDMSPIRLWWEEMDSEQRRRFYWHQLGMIGEPPPTCGTDVVERIFQQHLRWPGLWVVFSIQDIFALRQNLRREDPKEERINVPANPQHYWRYRCHVYMEDLLKEEVLIGQLKGLLAESGRY